jgi:PAS domain S-box-containing protein
MLDLLFERCSEAVFTVARTSMIVVAANQRTEELTGLGKRAIVGGPATALFGSEDEATEILARAGLHDEVTLVRLDGYPVYVELTVAHWDDPEHGPMAACIARDTTERLLLERELIAKHMALHAAHADLERAVGDLTVRNQELAERNRELALASAQLSLASRRVLIGEISSGIAHSLNNPLAALASAHRQLQKAIGEDGSPELKARVKKFDDRMRHSIGRIEEITHAVRRAHRTGTASTERRHVRLAEELQVALTIFESHLSAIDVDAPLPAELEVDVPPADLQHVLWNLIDNAIRAMPRGGKLRIFARQDGPRTCVGIEDSGPGVPEARRPLLFEAFASGRPDGSGLGLSTARRLARAWGGDVCYVPTACGARFEVSFASGGTQ